MTIKYEAEGAICQHIAIQFVAADRVQCEIRRIPPIIQREATNARSFMAKGTVMELKPDGRTVVIQHEAISNYMAA